MSRLGRAVSHYRLHGREEREEFKAGWRWRAEHGNYFPDDIVSGHWHKGFMEQPNPMWSRGTEPTEARRKARGT